MLNILKIVPDTIVDGPRMRTALYLSGCFHGCPGCHNKESWKPWTGKNYENDEVIQEIIKYDHNRLTISGGDGLCYQLSGLLEFLKELKIKLPSINIWLYTGYIWEDLKKDSERNQVLEFIDVLVDGKFEENLKSKECLFRGSTNQRLIDVKKSLEEGKVILYME